MDISGGTTERESVTDSTPPTKANYPREPARLTTSRQVFKNAKSNSGKPTLFEDNGEDD